MLRRVLGPLAARWPWVETALRVQERFSNVQGGYLASAVTLNVFTSLFPALLVVIAILGFFTSRSTDLAGEIISNLGLGGQMAEVVDNVLADAAESSRATSIIGVLGLAWSGLGVTAAIQYAFDRTWQHTGRGIKDKLTGAYWALGALLILGLSIALTAAVDVVVDGWILVALSAVVATAINFGFWMWTFIVLSFQRVDWHAYVPGALLAGVGLEIIKQAASLIGKAVSGSSALYGSLGAAFAILAILLIFGRLLVYSSVLNVVRWEEDHGTVTVDIEVPKVPGEVPVETDRAGAVEPD